MNRYLLITFETLERIFTKFVNLFTDVFAYIFSFLSLTALAFFGETRIFMIKLVLIAVVLDLFWGIWSSIKRKKFLCSMAITATIIKLLAFGTFFAIANVIELGIGQDFVWLSRVVCVILCTGESWSIFAHLLIIKPDFPVLKLLKKLLAGEISKKLHIEEKDIYLAMGEKPCIKVATKICDNCGDCKIVKPEENEKH